MTNVGDTAGSPVCTTEKFLNTKLGKIGTGALKKAKVRDLLIVETAKTEAGRVFSQLALLFTGKGWISSDSIKWIDHNNLKEINNTVNQSFDNVMLSLYPSYNKEDKNSKNLQKQFLTQTASQANERANEVEKLQNNISGNINTINKIDMKNTGDYVSPSLVMYKTGSKVIFQLRADYENLDKKGKTGIEYTINDKGEAQPKFLSRNIDQLEFLKKCDDLARIYTNKSFVRRLKEIGETLKNWDPLNDGIDLKTFEDLYRWNSENSINQKKYTERISLEINDLENKFLEKLAESIKSLTNEENPDNDKAECLIKIAENYLEKKGSVGYDNHQLSDLKERLRNKLEVISYVSSGAVVPNGPSYIQTIPAELENLLMGYLDVKDLRSMAQVSKTFNAFADEPAIWKTLCQKDPLVNPEDVTKCSDSFKLLYKKEADLERFTTGKYFHYFKLGHETLGIELDYNHPDLRGKHVLAIVKNELRKRPEWKDKDLDGLYISAAGRGLKEDDKVKDQEWGLLENVYIKVR